MSIHTKRFLGYTSLVLTYALISTFTPATCANASVPELYGSKSKLENAVSEEKPCSDSMWVGDFYDKGKEVVNSKYPQGLRSVCWDDIKDYFCSKPVDIKQGDGRYPLEILDYDSFSDDFDNEKMGDNLRHAFEKHDVNPDKFWNLMDSLEGSEKIIKFYRNDREGEKGYGLVASPFSDCIFVFPTKPRLCDAIYNLYAE